MIKLLSGLAAKTEKTKMVRETTFQITGKFSWIYLNMSKQAAYYVPQNHINIFIRIVPYSLFNCEPWSALML